MPASRQSRPSLPARFGMGVGIGIALLLAATSVPTPAQTVVESDIPEAGFPLSDAPNPAHPSASAPNPRGNTPDIPRNTPTIQVYSREVVVDVIVTDAQGKPVHGLTKADFTVAENGHPQSIRSFGEFGSGTQAAAPILPKLPSGVFTNYQASPATGPVNLILIDALNEGPVLAAREQQTVIDYIHAMPAGTQVAIFTLSFSGLHVLQGFTSDPSLLLRAMDTNFLVLGSNTETIRRDWATLDALDRIAAYVAGIKGRKNLLWFTSTMPILLTRDGGFSWGVPDMGIVHRTMDTYERFTAEQIAVSPIDASGVKPFKIPHGGLFTVLQNTPPQLLMEAVAEQTGGQAFYENNDLKSLLGQAIYDGSQYYTLSYVPPARKEDGRLRQIKIDVDRPGLHLVYRIGYNAEDPPPQHSPTGPALMQAVLEGQAPAATAIFFDVRVEPTPQASAEPLASGRRTLAVPGKAQVRYDFLYSIPAGQITFAATPDGLHTGSVEFDLAAFDKDGKMIGNATQAMHLPLSTPEYRDFVQTPFQFLQHLDLPPGDVFLRVGIMDGVSNKVGTTEIQLSVPKASAKKLDTAASPGGKHDR